MNHRGSTRDYLKLPSPGAIALAMVTIANLATWLLMLWLFRQAFACQF